MKKIKRHLSVLLSLIMAIGAAVVPISEVSADAVSAGNYYWNYSSVGGRADYDETMGMSDFIISQDRFGKYDNEYLNYNDRQNLGFYLYGSNDSSKNRPGNNTQAVVVDNMVKDGEQIAPKAFKINGGFETNYQPAGTVAASLSGVVLAKDKSGYYTYHPYVSAAGKIYAAFIYSPINEESSNGQIEAISAASAMSGRLFTGDTPIKSAEYNGKSISVTAVSGGQNLADSGNFAKLANAFAKSGIIPADNTVPETFTTTDYANVTVDYNAAVSGSTVTLNYAINYKFASGDVITFRAAPFVITASGYKVGSAATETAYSSEDYNNSKYEHADFKQKFGYAYLTLDRSTSQGFATVNSAAVSTSGETREYKYDSSTTGYTDYRATKSNSVVFNAAGYGGFDTQMLNYDRTARLAFYTYVKDSNYRIINKIQGVALDDIGGEAPTSFRMNGGYYATNRERIGGAYFPGIIAASDDSGYYGYNCSLDKSGKLFANFIYIASSEAENRVATTGITTSNRFFVITVMKISDSLYNGKKIDESAAPINTGLYKSKSELSMYVNGLASAGLIPATSVIPTENSSYESQRYTVDYNVKNDDGKITIDFSVSYKYDNGDVLTVNYYPLVITSDAYSFNGGEETKYAESPNSVYKQAGLSHENFSARFGYMCYVTSGMELDAYSTVNYAKLSFTDSEIPDNADCKHTSIKTIPATAATCTEDGIGEREVCRYCGKLIKDSTVIKALGHNLKTDKKEPTCTVAGSETTYCTRCDYKSVVSIPAKGHTVNNMKITKQPTCTAAGQKSGTCTVCGKTVTETIPATGHIWGDWEIVTPATTTAEGLQKHKCSVCAKEETEKIPKIKAYTVYDWTYTDTSTTGANAVADTLAKSAVTADVITHAVAKQFSNGQQQVNSVGNNIGFLSMSDETVAVFNTPDGYKPSEFTLVAPNYTSNNGIHVSTGAPVIGRVSNASGQDVVYSVYVASVRNGNEHTRCELVLQGSDGSSKVIPMNLTNPVTGATGNTYNAVKGGYLDGLFRNNLTYTYNIVPGDDSVTVNISIRYDRPTANPAEVYTFTADPIVINAADLADGSFTPAFGIASGMLNNNALRLAAKVYSAKATYKYSNDAPQVCEHKNTKTIAEIPATCTTAGKTAEVVCADCGAHISGGETTNALGHDYKTVTVESTCTVKGSTTTTCTRCDYKDVKELPLKDHTAAAERKSVKAATCTAEGYTGDVVCKDCGTVIEAGKTIAKADHTPSDWIIDTPATSTSDGSKHTECTVCGTVLETEVIPATGVAYGDLNGDGVIDASDAMAVLRYNSLLATLTDDLFIVADVNGDGAVTSSDAILLLQYDAKVITEFPVNKH